MTPMKPACHPPDARPELSEKNETIAITDLMSDSGVGFGTSGARGLADAMTDRVCYLYTVGFLQYLERQALVQPGDQVALAADHRPSSPRIATACAAAAVDLGYQPVYCGHIPSPALAAYAYGRQVASLMVTGSHIPDDRNGIKFNLPSGEILKQDEAGIREQVVTVARGQFGPAGEFEIPRSLPAEDGAAYRAYVARYLDYFPEGCLSGQRVLVYEHSSVAARAMTEIFAGLGADVIRRGYSEAFLPVDTEAVRPEDEQLALDWAASERFDLIVSADGDGDRPLVGDERGRWLRGDVAGVLTAHFLDADSVVTPVSSNTLVERCGWFARVTRTRIGSPHVIAAMIEERAAGAERVVGYEANGGFLTMMPFETDGRVLEALPTRDAVIVALAVLLSAIRRGVAISQLLNLLPPRFTASDRLKEFPSELSQARIAALEVSQDSFLERFPDLGAPASIDTTDGLRITFGNDEIVHLRPSGNAPELRCYTEAATEERARELNVDCLAWLDSWRE
jgi:phosphomannomutase